MSLNHRQRAWAWLGASAVAPIFAAAAGISEWRNRQQAPATQPRLAPEPGGEADPDKCLKDGVKKLMSAYADEAVRDRLWPEITYRCFMASGQLPQAVATQIDTSYETRERYLRELNPAG